MIFLIFQPITERLVKSVLPDVIKVVIDYNEASSKKKKKVDTGMFTMIYKGKSSKPPSNLIGAKFLL